MDSHKVNIGLLVKNKVEYIYKDKIWSFFCDLTLSSVICQPIHSFNDSCGFQMYQNRFNQKFFLGKNLAVTIVYTPL